MTSPRGACHLRSCAYALELTGKFWKYKDIDRFSIENKGEIIANLENLMALYDALGICKFQRGFYLLENVPELVKLATGLETTEKELFKAGERVHTLKKLFNLREGFGRKDDALPPRLTSEPIPEGIARDSYIKPEEAEAMLDEYYHYRGWDSEGVPSAEKLKELGLEDFKL
jgi:aldehyde:ferredoxin oxidoreductase